jgi:hypothetical protein
MAARARGSGGFGYDPVFVPDGGATGARWPSSSDAEKDAISHRGAAIAALREWLDPERAGMSRAHPGAPPSSARRRSRSPPTRR